jgi:glycosyltransferase involved in cell wall biosynthesis
MASEGFNIIGYSRGEVGVGELSRSLARAFSLTDIPFGLLNFKYGHSDRDLDLSMVDYEIPKPLYNKTILAMNPENAQGLLKKLEDSIFKRSRKVIAYWVWELEKLPDWWLPTISLVDEIWVPSAFVRSTFKQYTPTPVHVVPHVIEIPPSTKSSVESIRDLGIPEKSFVFLTNADPLSCMERKNPLGVVKAFKHAFPLPGDDRVHLIVKTNTPPRRDPHYEELKRQAKHWPNITLVNKWMRREKLNALLDRTDCFVSLHRAEGFGLMPAEMMGRGKPVILTRWSGVTQYIRAKNCFPVDYRLVPVDPQFKFYYSPEHLWADPDLNQAASYMCKLVSNRNLGRQVGKRARDTILSQFSTDAIAGRIRTLLRSHTPSQ